jgi:hypothetical protein
MRIDESRQHRQLGQVDDLGAGRNRHIRANGPDALAFDDDDLVGGHCACLGVDETAGPDRGDLLRAGGLRRLGVNTEVKRDEQCSCKCEYNALRHRTDSF